MALKEWIDALGKEGEDLLQYQTKIISKELLHLPGPNWVDRIFINSDRSTPVLHSLNRLFSHGRLKDTGYLSILPVDQGVEHSAGSVFAANPLYFDPENIVKLAIEGGCNAVASTYGILSLVARKYAHKIPFILKINHNELLSYPNQYRQTLFSSVQNAYEMGACAVGATVYFGSPDSAREIEQIATCFSEAHRLGMATVLWCYLRNDAFKTKLKDYHDSADLTGQANYLGTTLGADIVKQKLPLTNGGYLVLNQEGGHYGKYNRQMYDKLIGEHVIDYCRYQVINGQAGRVGLINSGGASTENDLLEAVKIAIINKRAGGMGLISGRKAFQCDKNKGIELLHAIQDIYLDPSITIA